jgi:hypothetical protein
MLSPDRSVAVVEILTALVLAGVLGWAAWSLIAPIIHDRRIRRLERRVWAQHRRRVEAERLGLRLGSDPSFLRGQHPRDRGRR